MSDSLRTRGSVRPRNDTVQRKTVPPAHAVAAASTNATATTAATCAVSENLHGMNASAAAIPPPGYEDVMDGHRRTVVYGLVDLKNKNNFELQNMMLMAERLKLSRLWSVCAEILEDRYRVFAEMEEARRVASLARPHLQNAIEPEVGPKLAGAKSNNHVTFLAGSRKRGKIKT